MALPVPQERRDATVTAQNKVLSAGYTRSGTDANLYTKAGKSFRVPDPITSTEPGLAKQVNNVNGSETLLATVRLNDDTQTALTGIL